MPFSWLVERVSRSFINKRLLRDFLMEELEEWQTRVVSSERALYLLDLKLRADSLNVLLDGVCGVRIVSASIDKLVIKFPSLTDIQRQSGLLEVSANVINVELDTVMEATEADGVAHIGAEQLAASLSALRQELAKDIAHEDAPDVQLDATVCSEPGCPGESRQEEDKANAGRVRSNLERLIEKALGATRLSVENVHIRLHLRSAHLTDTLKAPLATVGVDLDKLAMTNNTETLHGSPVNLQPGRLVSKTVTLASLCCTWTCPPAGPAATGAHSGANSGANSHELVRIREMTGGGCANLRCGVRVAVEYQHALSSRVLVRCSMQVLNLLALLVHKYKY